MNNRKLLLLILVILILIVGIFFVLQKNTLSSKTISPITENNSVIPNSPLPTPSPSPLLNITSQSNLTQEINSLKIPDFNEDYQKLETTLSKF